LDSVVHAPNGGTLVIGTMSVMRATS
jgi:hypothetical protein